MANILMNLTKMKNELPERDDYEFYETPTAVIDQCNRLLFDYLMDRHFFQPIAMLDMGADRGQWGQSWLKNQDVGKTFVPQTMAGIELREMPKPEPYNSWYSPYSVEDYDLMRYFAEDIAQHQGIAFGNPPYLRTWSEKKKAYINDGKAMTEFVYRCIRHFRVVAFLLRNDFQESSMRYKRIFQHEDCAEIHTSVKRINFVGRGNAQYRAFAFYIFSRYNTDYTQHRWFNR